MTDQQNPFGEGGLDMNALLEQAQAMQQQMVAAQEQLAETTVAATVGDGLVSVTLSGTGDLVRVGIRKGSFDPDETEDLEDLIVAAYRDAKTRADALASQTLGPLAGGFGGEPDEKPGGEPGHELGGEPGEGEPGREGEAPGTRLGF